MTLTWTAYEVHEASVLELTGQLCTGTVRLLEAQMARLLAGSPDRLVLDLSGIDICDPAGLAMLDACDRAASAAGVRLCLAAPNPPMHRALRARGLMFRLLVFGSVDGAARGDAVDLLSVHPPPAGTR